MVRCFGLLAVCFVLWLAAPSAFPQSDAALNSTDTAFVKKAAEGGHGEVELGRLAAQKASDATVKEFGRRMVRDHTKANARLAALTKARGVNLPDSPDLKMKAEELKLKVMSGKRFDRSYIDLMVDDHNEDVKEFQKESESAQDPQVKKFATETLPVLESHQKEAQRIQAKLQSENAR